MVRSPEYTAAMYRPRGRASSVRIATKAKIVSHPRKVMRSELLSAHERIEEVGADEDRHDQAEEIGGTHICSIPYTRASRRANMRTPRRTARTSMPRCS